MPRRLSSGVAVAAGFALIALVLWTARLAAPHVVPYLAHAQMLGRWAPLAYMAIYSVAVVALIPGSWFTPIGGALFGFGRGVVYSLAAATLGSTLAFLIGRYLARDLVQRRLEHMPRFAEVDRAVARKAARLVTLLRLSPVMPFNLLNYGLGVTAIRLRDFVIGSVGMIPSACVYAYAGKVVGEAVALRGPAAVPRTPAYYALLALGLIATVAATIVVTRTARRALPEV